MSAMGDSVISSMKGQAGSTIERLAELAKGATQGEWHLRAERYKYITIRSTLGNIATMDCIDGEGARTAKYIAACNPAAIAQAAAEYAELVEAAKLAESALSFIYGGEPVDPTGAITALRAALAQCGQGGSDAKVL